MPQTLVFAFGKMRKVPINDLGISL